MSTPKRSRFRRIAKWTGLVACGLILLLWVITFFWESGYTGTKYGFSISPGYFGFAFCGPYRLQGFYLVPAESSCVWAPIPHLCVIDIFVLPFSLLLLVIAIPTAYLFWRDHRRIPPDCCLNCGYNLTGNTSGICPECGTPLEVPSA
jgi:hypothetical protein